MKLSFIVPAYNEEKYLGPCLEFILKVSRHAPWPTEILVIDNASTDRTAEVAGSFPEVRVIHEPNKGLTIARERGLLEAKGELLAYLDADTRLHEGWLKIVEETFKDPGVVSISGPYKYFDLFGFRKIFAELIWQIITPPTYWLTGYMILGGNFVAKRSALKEMGGFNTKIRFYGEDTDIAWRLARLGKVMWRMDFFVWTSARRLLKDGLLKSYWIYGVNYLWEALFHKPFTNEYRDIR